MFELLQHTHPIKVNFSSHNYASETGCSNLR